MYRVLILSLLSMVLVFTVCMWNFLSSIVELNDRKLPADYSATSTLLLLHFSLSFTFSSFSFLLETLLPVILLPPNPQYFAIPDSPPTPLPTTLYLHYTLLHCTELHYTEMHCITPPSFTLHWTILLCTILHWIEMHCTILDKTALQYTAL